MSIAPRRRSSWCLDRPGQLRKCHVTGKFLASGISATKFGMLFYVLFVPWIPMLFCESVLLFFCFFYLLFDFKWLFGLILFHCYAATQRTIWQSVVGSFFVLWFLQRAKDTRRVTFQDVESRSILLHSLYTKGRCNYLVH